MCTSGLSHAAEGGTQFLPLVLFLSFSLEGVWRVREVLFLSFSLEGCWSKYPDSGLELPVYIGLEIYWTPGLFGTAIIIGRRVTYIPDAEGLHWLWQGGFHSLSLVMCFLHLALADISSTGMSFD